MLSNFSAAFLVCCFFSVTAATAAAATGTNCLACSYNYAGDGSRDRECVTNATHFVSSVNVSCNFATHSCVIIATYEPGYTRLSSLSRTCEETPNGLPAYGCQDLGGRPRCRQYCRSDWCNVGHGDIHMETDDGNGAASLGKGRWWWGVLSGSLLLLHAMVRL
ncbi:uncharacterized protein LOC143290489 [Babylonia areolata]|uniref:uncharacterized protein LOC143290489 n=1 Tax=Babylonia areolata TaxID=304850 RepID=UPI003FD426AB